MNIACPQCRTQNPIPNAAQYQGKTIQFQCINALCGHTVTYRFPPTSVDNDVTYISSKTKQRGENGKLTVLQNEFHAEYTFALKEGNQSIGRKSLNAKSELQIQTNDTTMSRSHCQIIGQKSKNGASLEFVLKDYNSTNKVYLNGVQLGSGQEAYLSHGDHIKIGNSLLLFEYV